MYDMKFDIFFLKLKIKNHINYKSENISDGRICHGIISTVEN